MLDIGILNKKVAAKLSTQLSLKQAKKLGQNPEWLSVRLKSQIEQGLSISEHFTQRVLQRFTDKQEQDLVGAICRCIKNTKPLEFSRSDHLKISQKFIDEATNIVIVLERMGEFGAHLVTTYILGKEDEFSVKEIADLTKRGILC